MRKKMLTLFWTLLSVAMLLGVTACFSGKNAQPLHTHVLTHHDSVESSCTQEGNIEYWSCEICGKYFSTSFGDFEVTHVNLTKKNHILTHHNGIRATCTQNGRKEYWTCNVCDKIFSDELGKNGIDEFETTIAFGHNYDTQNRCIRCGQTFAYTAGLIYYISLTEGGYFVAGGSNLSGEVIIPPYYNGLPVKGIGYKAFFNCADARSFVIPSSVTEIEQDAFYGTAYYNDENNWENGVLYIGKFLIKAKPDISGEYRIKNGTIMIADCAFEDCNGLTGITIPDSLKNFGIWAFYGCNKLTNINYAGELSKFCDISGVDNLRSYGLNNRSFFIKVLLNGREATGNVTIGNTINTVRLERVYYKGTKEDWNRISFGDYDDLDLMIAITSAKRYYFIENEADVPKGGGNYWHYVNEVPTAW